MHIQNTLPQFDNYTLDNYRLKKSVTYKKACILIFSGNVSLVYNANLSLKRKKKSLTQKVSLKIFMKY